MESLTLVQEQDSTGNSEWCAALYTPAGGSFQGRGATPEAAILELAGKIRQAQNQKAMDRLGQSARRAFVQPMPSAPGLLDTHIGDVAERLAKITNVGKIVHYMPNGDDVTEQPGQVLPAIITREWAGGRMDLQVFGNKSQGTLSRYSVEYSASGNSGTWDWPKKG